MPTFHRCIVGGCFNDLKTKNNTTYHCFPLDGRRKIWIERANNDAKLSTMNKKQISNARICGEHFERSQFFNDLKLRLCYHALPTIFPDKTYDVPSVEEIRAILDSRNSCRDYTRKPYVPVRPIGINYVSQAEGDKHLCTSTDIIAIPNQIKLVKETNEKQSILDPLAIESVFSNSVTENIPVPFKIGLGLATIPEINWEQEDECIVETSSHPLELHEITEKPYRSSSKDFNPKISTILVPVATLAKSTTLVPKVKINHTKRSNNPRGLLQVKKPSFSTKMFKTAILYNVLTDQTPRKQSPVIRQRKEKVYPVHKGILAAKSPVLAALFEQHTTGNRPCQQVNIDLNDNVLTEMLHFVYKGQLGRVRNMADLLAAADKYAIKELFTLCESKIYFTVNTAAELLILADKHKAEILTTRAVSFINSNSDAVMKTSGWNQMIQTHPQLLAIVYRQAMVDRTKTVPVQETAPVQETQQNNDAMSWDD